MSVGYDSARPASAIIRSMAMLAINWKMDKFQYYSIVKQKYWVITIIKTGVSMS